jgi:hypothetical protein
LEYITPKCLEELIALFLADELRTEVDRHDANYFFYKKPKSEKFEGIIAIDNEISDYATFRATTDEEFRRYINIPYFAYTPIGTMSEEISYKDRLKQIKSFIDSGKLTEEQVSTLRKEVLFDFPKAIREASNHPKLKAFQNKIYDSASRLWEYNRKELEKELSL